MSVLIKNGRVITATDDFFADIYIQDDKVMAIGKDLNFDADTIIVLNVEEDSILSAREILFYGSKLTFDCLIKLKQNGKEICNKRF